MKVYVVFRFVPFEFGEIRHICATHQVAVDKLTKIKLNYDETMFKEDEWVIDEWEVEGE